MGEEEVGGKGLNLGGGLGKAPLRRRKLGGLRRVEARDWEKWGMKEGREKRVFWVVEEWMMWRKVRTRKEMWGWRGYIEREVRWGDQGGRGERESLEWGGRVRLLKREEIVGHEEMCE